jgi:hypothetical protein
MKNIVSGNAMPHKYIAVIDSKKFEFDQPIVTSEELLTKAGKKPIECYSIYQKLEGCDLQFIPPGEQVDLRQLGIEHFEVKDPVVFHYMVNKEPETTEYKNLIPNQILKAAGLDPDKVYLIQLPKDGPKIIYAFQGDLPIKMVCPGLTFITQEWVKLVNIEEYGSNCKEVPVARKYEIKIDKINYIVDSPFITGQQLIELANKQPFSNWDVYKFYNNQPKPIKIQHGEVVDLMDKCLLRFVLQPKEQTDGESIRKDFSLPEEDVQFLDSLGLPWETLNSAGLWLIVHDYPVPEGYNTRSCQVALTITPGYPAVEIDMAYFHPHLEKLDRKPINAISVQDIYGRSFQRWSRHRKPGDWRPGIDNIMTHLTLVDNWLLNDLKR